MSKHNFVFILNKYIIINHDFVLVGEKYCVIFFLVQKDNLENEKIIWDWIFLICASNDNENSENKTEETKQ